MFSLFLNSAFEHGFHFCMLGITSLRLSVRKTCYTICLLRAFARKKGRNNVTVDDLVQVITPKGRGEFISIFFSLKFMC